MPIIPILQRRQSIPGEAASLPGNIGAAGLVGESIARAGARGMAVSDDFADLVARQNEDIRKRNAAAVSSDLSNKVGLFLNDSRRAYDESANKTDGPFALAEINKTAPEQFSTNLRAHLGYDQITDQDVKAHADRNIGTAEAQFKDHLAIETVKRNQQYADKVTGDALLLTLQNARSGKDWQQQMEYFTGTVQDLHGAGTYNGDKATDLIVKGQREITTSYLDGLVERAPGQAIAEIKSGRYSQYLSGAEFRRLNDKAESLQDAQKRDQKAAEAETRKVAKEAIEQAQKETGNQFIQAFVDGKLDEKSIITSNLDPTGENSKQYWLSHLAARRRRVEDTEADERQANEFLTLLVGGKLTEAQVLSSGLPVAKKEHWINQIAQRKRDKEVQAKKEAQPKTDQVVKSDLFSRIVTDPESVSEADILDRLDNGLLTSDVKALLAERSRRLKKEVDPARKTAEQAVIGNFRKDRDNGLYGKKGTPESNQEYARQVSDFQDWLKRHPEDDPVEYYEKLMEPRKASFVESVLDWTLGKIYDPTLTEPKIRREELKQQPSGNSERDSAITILKDAGKSVTENNIRWVMDKAKKGKK